MTCKVFVIQKFVLSVGIRGLNTYQHVTYAKDKSTQKYLVDIKHGACVLGPFPEVITDDTSA